MKQKHIFLLTGLLTTALFAGCTAKEEPAQPVSEEPPPAANNVDYLGTMAKAKNTAEKVVDLSSVQEAIKLFEAGEDRLPANLDELVSFDYLPQLPKLPQGYQYAYFPKSGRVKAVLVQMPTMTSPSDNP